MTETIGKVLRRLRKAADLTQPDLARRAWMTQSTISRLETDRYPMSLETAHRLDAVLSPDAHELTGLVHRMGLEGVSTVTELAAVVSVYRRLEDETSPEVVLPAIREALVLAEVFISEAALRHRAEAAALASEIAQYRGWLEHATGNDSQADRYFDRAVALAIEYDDPDRLSHGLSFRAHSSLERGNVTDAKSLTHAALRDSRVHPLLRVYDHYQLARVHAQLDEPYAAQRALIVADKAAEQSEPETPPESGYWYTPGLWGLHRSRVLWQLGQHRQAVTEAHHGMQAMPPEHQGASWMSGWARAIERGDLSTV